MSYDIVNFFSLDDADKNLANLSIAARETSYCPYSKLQVGAALICEDSTIFTGCNVENASFGMSICAEKTAIVKAVSKGHKIFKTIAVSSLLENSSNFVTPCGSCRQVISEFSSGTNDTRVLVVKADRTEVLRTKISHLMPLSFKF